MTSRRDVAGMMVKLQGIIPKELYFSHCQVSELFEVSQNP